jgi:hypothetical protein
MINPDINETDSEGERILKSIAFEIDPDDQKGLMQYVELSSAMFDDVEKLTTIVGRIRETLQSVNDDPDRISRSELEERERVAVEFLKFRSL